MKSSKRHERARADIARAERQALATMRHEQRTTEDPRATALEHQKLQAARKVASNIAPDLEQEVSAEYAAAAIALDEHLRARRQRQARES